MDKRAQSQLKKCAITKKIVYALGKKTNTALFNIKLFRKISILSPDPIGSISSERKKDFERQKNKGARATSAVLVL